MSDKSEGPGWWIASDGKWYPPELHPAARGAAAPPARPVPSVTPHEIASEQPAVQHAASRPDAPQHVAAQQPAPQRWQSAGQSDHVGPQFPDLFQKALQGNHVADAISVKYDGDDERNTTGMIYPTRSAPATPKQAQPTPEVAGASAGASDGAVGSFSGASASKRRWRKGH